MNDNRKQYIGDGVYVDYDGFHLVLTTEDGISVTNTIYLDKVSYRSLILYVQNIPPVPEAPRP